MKLFEQHQAMDLSPVCDASSAEEAATIAFWIVCETAAYDGYNPTIEVQIRNPRQPKEHGYVGANWHVVWECGPDHWAICQLLTDGKNWHTETHWGFDLIFYEDH